ncbi:LOW QUALITY PROTEIN: reverse transcriptase [Phytophthora palmivora]|uniref:Reverse transcriptase n=1 Tax=Phytophthora palmivora TaxID=4796 RepID=A0A2P4X2G1_9STRA|nr:LOW QUALITY PROTEIN: reverse transcriptase [Phytophthora palmivora]
MPSSSRRRSRAWCGSRNPRTRSTPTFCVHKPNGKWRLVHAYNKLNNATVPAQTPIPRKDVLLNNIALDLVDGYYQILMRESDIPLTAHPKRDALGVASDATGAFELPQRRLIAWSHNCLDHCVHLKHLRRVFEVMRANKLYVNIDKRVFAAEEITILGCFVSRVGVRADPGKVKAIEA